MQQGNLIDLASEEVNHLHLGVLKFEPDSERIKMGDLLVTVDVVDVLVDFMVHNIRNA